jgi:hypothetical protein
VLYWLSAASCPLPAVFPHALCPMLTYKLPFDEIVLDS